MFDYQFFTAPNNVLTRQKVDCRLNFYLKKGIRSY